jgi:hypothetical protein
MNIDYQVVRLLSLRNFFGTLFGAVIIAGVIGWPWLSFPLWIALLWGSLKVNAIVCPHCHKRVKFGASVCRFCGRDV